MRVDRRHRVRGLADGEADGMAELLELASGAQQILPRIRRLLAYLLEQVDPVAAGKGGEQQRDAEPLSLDLRVLLAGADTSSPCLRASSPAMSGDVDQPGLEEPRVVHLEAHDVVAGAGHELGGELGRHLHALHVVDADVHAGGLREPLAELVQLDVRGRRVVHGGQDAELTRRPGGRRSTKDPGDSDQGRPAGSKETTSADPALTIATSTLRPPLAAPRLGQAGGGSRFSGPRRAWRAAVSLVLLIAFFRSVYSSRAGSTASRAWPDAAWHWPGR